MKAVIFVNGSPRAGKDTLVEMMSAHAMRNGLAAGQFSSIEPVKAMLLAAGIDTSSKTEADRKLLALVGDALQEHAKWRTYWCAREVRKFFAMTGPGVFFLHVREPVVIAQLTRDLRKQFDIWTIRVDSDRAENVTSNSADAGVHAMRYDLAVLNNGTLDDLSKEACTALRCIAGHLLPNTDVQLYVEPKLN